MVYGHWQREALKIFKTGENPVLMVTFHDNNIEYLLQHIYKKVKDLTGTPPEGDFSSIMQRNLLHEYSILNGFRIESVSVRQLPADTNSREGKLEDSIIQINRSIVKRTCKDIISSMKLQDKYLKEIGKVPVPYSKPKDTRLRTTDITHDVKRLTTYTQ